MFESIQLLNSSNSILLLSPGNHIILPITGLDGPHCGLIPLGRRVRSIQTSGLTWDVDGELEMGVFISVCNRIPLTSYINYNDFIQSERGKKYFPSNVSTQEVVLSSICICRDRMASLNFASRICQCSVSRDGIRISSSDPILWTSTLI